jgi:tRNA A-37 threonylcarbamoyl transferase component Bud32
MSDPRRCPQCGAPLPADAQQGLCPKCLLQLGFESQAGPASSGNAGPTVYQPRFIPPTVEELAARFPQLVILEEIGHGGMGVVYKARQKDLDRVVALKILRPDIEHDPAFAERFVREARALGKLSHPAIVTVYDFGRSDGLFFLVMEYVDGANLRQLERTGKLTPAEALRIVPAICEALQYAHDQGVVHRDIKPENILIDKGGRVKIADFGLAKMVGAGPDAATLTGAWHVMGTPHYMAPEQMQGAHAVDHRADIYSLGVVIYEMLTGELPVGRFPLPSQKVQVDVRLDEVVLRSLEREPGRRYQHASDVKTEIETISREAAATPSTSMPPAGWYYGLWGTHEPGYADWVRRRLLLWLPISLILALVALLLGALAGNLDEPLFGMVIGSALVLFPMWLLLRKQEQEERRRPRADFEARTVTDDSGREAGLDGPAATQTRAQPAQVGNVQTGREMTAPALTRHAFGFWSRPQPGYDRRVGWPVMAALALWVVAVLSLIGLNLAGAPIDSRIITVVLIAGIAGLPVLLIVLTLAYFVRGRSAAVEAHAGAGTPGQSGRSIAATDSDRLAAELKIPWIGLLVTGGLELTGGAVVAALHGLRVIGIGQTELLLLIGPSLLLGFVTVMTALRLRSMRNYGAAVAGCIVCAVPLSYGWWMRISFVALAMLTLRRPEARDAFEGGSALPGTSAGRRRDSGWTGGTTLLMFALWVICVLLLSGSWAAGATSTSEAAAMLLYAGLFALPPIILLFLIVRFAMDNPRPVDRTVPVATRAMSPAPEPATATQAPGTALIAVGVMEWIACWLSCLLFAIVALSGDRELPAIFRSRETLQVLLPVVAVLGAALSAIVILAGLKMKRLESRPFAIAGSILAMFVSPGNVIGLPIGLWALYQLTRPEVKAAFRRGPPQHLKPESEGPVRRPVLLFALAVIGIATVGAGVGVLWQPLTGDKFQQEPSAVPQSAVPRTTTDSGISQETTASTGSDDDTTADASLDDSLTYVERGTFRRPVATIADETVPPVQVAFSADGATLFALVGDSIYSWDTGKGASLGRKPIGEFVTGAVSVVLSPTGDALTLVQSDGSVELKDASSGQQRRRHAQGRARLALFAPDQRMLAVAEDDATLLLWDVGQPSKPATRLSDLSVSSLAFSADGSLLATGCVDGTVRLLEVASGDVLTKLGSVAGLPVAATVPAITCLAFSAGGDKLAAGLREGAVQIWNIATGSLETTFQAAEGLSGLAWSPDGTLLATASVGGAITTWQTPDADRDDVLRSHGPSRLRLIRVGHIAGAVDAPFTAMAATESYACLIQGDAVQGKTLRVVDVSIPAAPRVAGSCALGVEAWDVAAAGSCVYVVEEPHLRIIDVSDPTQPRAVGSCPLGEHLWNVAVDGRYAYVTDINSLRVVDVMDPTAPREVGRCEVAEAQGITLSGRYAYIACDIEGVRVVDISDPTAPREVGGFDGPAGAAEVAVSGKLAFVAGGEDAVSLWIADISDPLGPSSLGRYGDWIVGSVAALGEFALIAGGELDVVDVSDPLAPKQDGVYSGADQVMVEVNHVYVLGGDGFSILRAVRSAKDPHDVESP